jgi:hypothetical protein
MAVPIIAFFVPVLYLFFIAVFIFVLVSKFPRYKGQTRTFLVKSASPLLASIMLIIIVLTMTPPIGLLIIMSRNGLDQKLEFTNAWKNFLFGFVCDTLADELRVFSTLALVTVLINELLKEAKKHHIFDNITKYEKIYTCIRIFGYFALFVISISAFLELLFAALVQYYAIVIGEVTTGLNTGLYIISWVNDVMWMLCFLTFLILSCLIFYRSMKMSTNDLLSQKSLIMLFVLNVVSDVTCLMIAIVSWVFAVIQKSEEISVSNFYVFYDVSAVINIGWFAFVFLLIGPLNKKVLEVSTPHVPLQEEEEVSSDEERQGTISVY